VPPIDEQRAIAAFLDRETAQIDRLIAKKQLLIELLKEKRQSVISRAVTKGLDPKAPMKPSGISWLGDIPAHWEMKRIGFLTTSQGGCTPSKDNSAFWNGDIPWVTPKDMKTDVISDSTDHVTDEALQNTGLKLIPHPVVLIVVRGMILAHTFPVALTQAPVTINQDMKALTPASNLDAEFLSCLLRACSPAFFAIVEESGHGTRVLRTDLWSKQELPIPSLEEQKEIAGFVARTAEQYDQLADKVKRAIDRLTALRSSLITAAVTGQIDVRNYQKEAPCP
jgi:type I restriction enzyme S subunit